MALRASDCKRLGFIVALRNTLARIEGFWYTKISHKTKCVVASLPAVKLLSLVVDGPGIAAARTRPPSQNRTSTNPQPPTDKHDKARRRNSGDCRWSRKDGYDEHAGGIANTRI